MALRAAAIALPKSIPLLVLSLASACGEDAPPCDLSPAEQMGRVLTVTRSGFGAEAVLTVVRADRDLVRLEADRSQASPDEVTVDLRLRNLASEAVALPPVGDDVETIYGDCHDLGYVRVTSPDGVLLFEGGNPRCNRAPEFDPWEPPPRLGTQDAADPQPCVYSCVSEAFDTTLTVNGTDELLPIGEPREITIDGRRYLAEAIFGRDYPACGTIDGGDSIGSAYVALLAD